MTGKTEIRRNKRQSQEFLTEFCTANFAGKITKLNSPRIKPLYGISSRMVFEYFSEYFYWFKQNQRIAEEIGLFLAQGAREEATCAGSGS